MIKAMPSLKLRFGFCCVLGEPLPFIRASANGKRERYPCSTLVRVTASALLPLRER
jgi:hypothetical protein